MIAKRTVSAATILATALACSMTGCTPTAPQPIEQGVPRTFNDAVVKAPYTEISTAVVPPGVDVVNCPGGRLFLSSTQSSQLTYRALDCPAVGSCPVTKTISDSAPMIAGRHPLPFTEASNEAGSCDGPAVLGTCGPNDIVTSVGNGSCPLNFRRYNDAVVTRTASGRIFQSMTGLIFEAPVLPLPKYDAGGHLVGLTCRENVVRAGIMLHWSDDCGATWTNKFVDMDGMTRPDGSVFQFARVGSSTTVLGNTAYFLASSPKSVGEPVGLG